MTVTTGTGTAGSGRGGGGRGAALRRDGARRDQLALAAELRQVDHWRRLVAARLDLAVAAVTGIDEPAVRSLPAAPAPPFGLRDLVGLAPPGTACAEVAVIDQLRAVRRDLDTYALALRALVTVSSILPAGGVVSRLDDHRTGRHAVPLSPVAAPCPDAAAAPPAALAPVLPMRGRRRAAAPDDVA